MSTTQPRESGSSNGRKPAENPQLLTPGQYRRSELPKVDAAFVMRCLNENEYGDAQLFAHLFQDRCVRDHTEGTWYIWQGHYWKKDKMSQLPHLVCGVLASVYLRASSDLARSPSGDDEAAEKLRREQVTKLADRGKALMNQGRMKHILELAESFLSMTGDMWDRDPWLLPTEEGVIELRKGVMRPGRPSDYVRIVCPTSWRGMDLSCPRYDQYWQEVFADRPKEERDELIAFMHRVLGYGLTGIVREQIFLFLYGEQGRNGKDTLMNILLYVLGIIVQKVPKDVFLAAPKNTSNMGAPSPHLITLQGKRIAYAEEPDKGERFSVGQIKDLTGQSPITARAPFDKHYRTFDPSHLLLMLSNNKPHADSSDAAFWDRICPIVYNIRFVDEPTKPNERKKDTSLSQALEAEASAILGKLVRGCLDWQEQGLNIPASVIAERKKYQQEEDTLGIFLREMCKAGGEVGSNELYEAYKEWSLKNSVKPMMGTSFGREIVKLYERKRKKTGGFYQGIHLLEIGEAPDVEEDTSTLAPEPPTPAPSPAPKQPAPSSTRNPNAELNRQMDEDSIPKKYTDAMHEARIALSRLPLGYIALTIGDDGKNLLDPQPALYYLSRLMETKEEKWWSLALRVIQEKLPIWQADAARYEKQQKEMSG